MTTLYDELEITPQASLRAIEQSFFRLAKKLDPTAAGNQGNTALYARYKAIHEAYRTLSDTETRRKYDQSLHIPSLSARVQALRAQRVAK